MKNRADRSAPCAASASSSSWRAGAARRRLWFVRSFDERVRVDGEIANQYALGPGRIAWFGTDALGADVFAKCIYGARTTLVVGVIATAIGLAPRRPARHRRRLPPGHRPIASSASLTDALLSLPAIVLAIVMIVKLDTVKEAQTWLGWLDRRWQITFTLGILAIAPLSRIVRARTLACASATTCSPPAASGRRRRRVIGREVLPNLVPTMLTVAFTGLGMLVAAEGALGVPRSQRRGADADVGQADRPEPQRHVAGLVGDGVPVPDAVPHRAVVQPHRRLARPPLRHP